MTNLHCHRRLCQLIGVVIVCASLARAQGIISTVAGNGIQGFSGDGGPAISARLNAVGGVAVDAAGNLYMVDNGNLRIRKITPGGTITTYAGGGSAFPGDGGPATSASFFLGAYGVAVDAAGNVYIAEGGDRIRKVTPGGTISTVAGNGTQGFSGDGGPPTSAQLDVPQGVAVDAAGNLYIADRDANRIRKVTLGGGLITAGETITTVAGNGGNGFSGDGGPATSAQLNQPWGVAVDAAGNLYIADRFNNRIRKVIPGGTISTVAGGGNGIIGSDGGPATSAWLDGPKHLAVDAAGNLYINDVNRIRTPALGSGARSDHT